MERHRREKSKHATRTAARTFVDAQLGWLTGFPIQCDGGTAWFELQRANGVGGRTISLSRETLRRAEFSRNAAIHRFPKALEYVVGDIDSWTARTTAQFDVLKSVVHEGAPLPCLDQLLVLTHTRRTLREAVSAAAKNTPKFTPLLEALLWIHWHKPMDELRQPVRAMQTHQHLLLTVMERIDADHRLVCLLHCLYLLEQKNGLFLVELLADQRTWEIALHCGNFTQQLRTIIKKLRQGKAIEQADWRRHVSTPHHRLGPELTEYLKQLVAMDKTSRQRHLRLLPAFLGTRELSAWDTWWQVAHSLERDVRRLNGPSPGTLPPQQPQKCREIEFLVKAIQAPPRAVFWRTIQDPLSTLSDLACPAAFDAAAKCIDQLDCVHPGLRLAQRFVEGWLSDFRKIDANWGTITTLLLAQHRVLHSIATPSAEHHSWVADGLSRELRYTWLYDSKPLTLLPPAIDALLLLGNTCDTWTAEDGPFTHYTGWRCLLTALVQTGDTTLATDLMLTVPPDSAGLHGSSWSSILRLVDADVTLFRAIAAHWKDSWWDDTIEEEISIVSKSNRPVAQLLAAAFAVGLCKRAINILTQSSLCRMLGAPRLEIGPRPAPAVMDIDAYPESLHDLLLELAAWDENAARAADQVLGSDFPLKTSIQRELDTLLTRLSTVDATQRNSLEARISSLERQLSTARHVSSQRLSNLRKKIKRRVLHARLARLEKTLEQHLCDQFTGERWLSGEMLDDASTMRLMTAVAGLGKDAAGLAFRLANVRGGPKPWDLRDDPANAAFIDKMIHRGVHIEHWLNGIEGQITELGGRQIRLSLEEDPLEVMRMGEPFDTCLAPGSFNFFSAVTNAADINKRVIYGCDSNGTVQARCLLALTDSGDILTFHVYAHSHHSQMMAAITAFVRTLAAAMGVSIVPGGEVSKLVATQWYDDGPVDLTGQLCFLKQGSSFLEQLNTISADNFVALIETQTGEPLSQFIACAVAQSGQLDERPDLTVTLLDYIGDPRTLDVATRIALGKAARQAGEVDVARQLTVPIAKRLDETYYCIPIQLAEELIALGIPHLALRAIRQSRHYWVRSWDEEDQDRIRVAAQALECLHRPRQALELFLIAAKKGCVVSQASANRLAIKLA